MSRLRTGALALVFLLVFSLHLHAQANAGSLTGTVTDATGAVIPSATVTIANPVSGLTRTVEADSSGAYVISNLPANRYHVSASATGFNALATDAVIRSGFTTKSNFVLTIGTSSTEVDVEAEDMVNRGATAGNTIDRALFNKLPLDSTSAPLSSLVTQSTPGIAADSNGLFHPMGEHADTTYAIDGQSISDQQSRVFGNQPSPNVIASINVINGIAPPEYGDKSSLVVETTTRSGLGLGKPTGSIDLGYGSFGTSSFGSTLGLGNHRLGEFLSLDVSNSGRYLDTPEFRPLHDHGNAINFFSRSDFKPSSMDSVQLNLSVSRSWFQQPNQYDQVTQDQRTQIRSFNVAPTWTHTISDKSIFTIGSFLRQDNFHYYPSNDLFDDTPVTLAQSRRLQQTGGHGDFIYSHGIHTIKAGISGGRTALSESFNLGVTNATFNAPCLDSNGAPVTDPTITSTSQCAASGYTVNDAFLTGLESYDLTRGGSLYNFRDTGSIFQEALYLSDNIIWKRWTVLVGGRFDNYSGLSKRSMAQPRVGASYTTPGTQTVLRFGYGKFFLTPYNENLLVSSSTGVGGLQGASNVAVPLKPASRHQFNAGFEQGLGKRVTLSGEYFWKYTDRDFDFDVVLNTPLAFPIQWQQSKIDGFGIKITVPYYKGFSAFSSLGHTRSRFFGPEVGGILSNDTSVNTDSVFRIDHDQAFQQSTNLEYQTKHGLWTSFTWNYESGMVAGAGRSELLGLTADQQAALKLSCNGVYATINAPITSCAPNDLKTPVLSLAPDGQENDDHRPDRVSPRHLFNIGTGWDNMLQRPRYKTNLSITASNLDNKYAVYNFLSTFSGTHFVAPRMINAKISFNF